MTAPTPITPSELRDILAPFVGTRLNHKRDADNYVIPRTHALDILCDSNKVDADVRALTDEGVEVFFYAGCDLVRWSDIREVTVRSVDARGETLAARRYRVVHAMKVAA